MPVQRNLEDLPRGSQDEGRPPDHSPRFVTKIAEVWWEAEQANRDRPMSIAGRKYRASWSSLRCDRAAAYAIARVPESDPSGMADVWRMGLGTMIHAYMDEFVQAAFPGAQVEVAADLRPEIDGAASVDLVVTYPDVISERTGKPWVVVLELKTVGGFPFKMGATTFKGPPEGPKVSAIIQGALAAFALDADEMVVGNLAMEVVSHDLAAGIGVGEAGRFAAEWTFPFEEYQGIARAEHQRVNWILRRVAKADDVREQVMQLNEEISAVELRRVAANQGHAELVRLVPRKLSDPEYPPGAIVTDVGQPGKKGRWTQFGVASDGSGKEVVLNMGETWMCGYCRHRKQCRDDG